MKVQHIKSGQEQIVTKEQWDQIVANGFKSDFRVLESPKPPEEVSKALKKGADQEKES